MRLNSEAPQDVNRSPEGPDGYKLLIRPYVCVCHVPGSEVNQEHIPQNPLTQARTLIASIRSHEDRDSCRRIYGDHERSKGDPLIPAVDLQGKKKKKRPEP